MKRLQEALDMREYEMIREIFNNCSGNQMRDVEITTVETDDTDAFLRVYLKETEADIERIDAAPGTVIYEVSIAGLRERFSFTEV
jgi:hypothetical protein